MILGAPLFVVLLAVALIGFYTLGIDLSVIAIEIYRLADTPLLVALPLFTFTGYLMAKSRTSERLVRLTREFLGWMPGGLAIVSLVACAVFTAFTGNPPGRSRCPFFLSLEFTVGLLPSPKRRQ